MTNRDETPRRRAYMLRFWEVPSHDSAGSPAWRFSLEDPHTGDKLGFANLEALVAFLSQELGEAPGGVGVPPSS
jgi:hypothetical protein